MYGKVRGVEIFSQNKSCLQHKLYEMIARFFPWVGDGKNVRILDPEQDRVTSL